MRELEERAAGLARGEAHRVEVARGEVEVGVVFVLRHALRAVLLAGELQALPGDALDVPPALRLRARGLLLHDIGLEHGVLVRRVLQLRLQIFDGLEVHLQLPDETLRVGHQHVELQVAVARGPFFGVVGSIEAILDAHDIQSATKLLVELQELQLRLRLQLNLSLCIFVRNLYILVILSVTIYLKISLQMTFVLILIVGIKNLWTNSKRS